MVEYSVREECLDLGPSNRVLILTDLHAHEYRPFSTPTAEGVGSRFLWVLKALNTIFQYALDNQIQHIFFLGDVFHHRTVMYSIVFEKIACAIEEAAKKGLKLHFILGNHDFIFSNDASPSLIRNIKGIDVIDSPTLYGLRNLDDKIAAMKFYFNPELMIEELIELNKATKERTSHLPDNTVCNHTLLGHFELIGAKVSDEYVLKEPVSPAVFDPTIFNHICSGHIHKAQVLQSPNNKKAVNFVGTPLQHRFNDEGNPFGFVVLDFSKHTSNKFLNYIPLDTLGKFPVFRTEVFESQEQVKAFMNDSANKARFDIDYFRIQSDNPELKLEPLFKRLTNYRYEDKGTVLQQDTEESDTNADLKFNLDINTYMELYIKEQRIHEDMDWIDKEKMNEFLDRVRVKGNIVQ